ncbi:MAG: LemA family protein [Cryobacterium sp.]|nr:LemA family protein [Oligoflexia bacterium]
MGIFIGFVAFFLLVLIVVLFMGVGIYNSLVSLKNQVDRAWSNIDVILKQRFDEIPQLLQVVEQYTGYEKGVIRQVTEARSRYGSANTTNEKVAAAGDLSLALRGVIAIGEAYPELKANASFGQLQTRVSGLESAIADRRETFNEAVTNLNTRIEQFPDLFFARLLGYTKAALLQATPAERSVPNLKMNLG